MVNIDAHLCTGMYQHNIFWIINTGIHLRLKVVNQQLSGRHA